MPEPASATATGVAIAAGTITLTGSIFGVEYEMLMAGFFGGLVSLSFLPQMSRMRVAGTIAASSIAAGFFGPAIAVTGLHYFPYLADLGVGIRLGAGATTGLFFQTVIPAIFRKISLMGATAK